MAKPFQYHFSWDPLKARENLRKHRVAFDHAATVFHDSDALSEFDEPHSQQEDRWITLGLDSMGKLLVVCHTYQEISESSAKIRMISARKATRTEAKQYRRV
ncbi:MAG: BrnT family toxin [Nitrospirota bacterium]|nr:BrnT family toxin [Nitrospirota bacterium]